MATHLERGGSAEFLTLTLQHHQGDRLASRLGTIAESLNLVLKGSGWDRRRHRLGYVGAIKAVEVTWGEANGWHPHSHTLLLFDRPLTEAEQLDLHAWIWNRWSAIARRRSLGHVDPVHGVDLRPVTDGDGIGSYLNKVDNGWSAGHELARGDRKGSAPVQLLHNLVATGEARWARLWTEYEAATFGKRALVWSPGLRAQLLGVEEETSDEQLAAGEGLDLTLFRALVESGEWNRVVRAGASGELLTSIEQGAALLLLLMRLFGYEPQPLDAFTGASP